MNLRARLSCVLEQVFIDRYVGIGPEPQLAWAKIREYCRHSPDVILMRVGEGYGVEAPNAARPQHGRNNIFANVEIRVWRRAHNSPRIHQKGVAVGRDDEQGITLADVDRCDFELTGAARDRARNDEDDASEQEGGH
jgi:hypothetical protein